MKKIIILILLSLSYLNGFSQSGAIVPNQGISVPQFTTSFIGSMTTQPKGTVVFDKDLNLMKYWDGTDWKIMTTYWALNGSTLSNSSTFVNLTNGSNITPIVSGAATDGTLKIFSPMPGNFFSGSQFITIDKDNIQARKTGTFPNFTKTEQNLRVNPFGGNVGIGTASDAITATLYVKKSTNSFDGTAVFKGTTHFSHFHYGTNEDTYIRGGKNNANIILNDISGGKVGIGVYPSTYTLEVNGITRSKEVIVETGWADYVFDEKYKLRSIEEMEAFVKENKHLPNIPKASDIEANGLKVGETNKAMMEKIEELALYIIQLKKEIDILKSKN